MKALNILRVLSCILSLASAGPAVAQMRDQEPLVPRVQAAPVAKPQAAVGTEASTEECHRLLRELTTTLQLQPYQVLVVRQALAAKFGMARTIIPVAEAADEPNPDVTPDQVLYMLLTDAQLARLKSWETSLPADKWLQLIALAQ